MLTRLQVRNYVLIDSLEIDFPEGLIIITGQTGAGKSILLGALSLLMGAKADASVVSEYADNCVVEAEFDVTSDNIQLKSLIEENDVEWDEGHLIIRRVVNRSGRSRSFVNDSPVSVSALQELSTHLVDIHSQHQTLLLSDKHFQMDILDYFCGNADLREKCACLWQTLSRQKSELKSLDEKIAAISSEKDYNEAQFRQLESASLRDGELAELEEEQKRLANAEDIKMALSAVEELYSPASDSPSVDASLKDIGRFLVRVSKYLPEAEALAERMDSCRREVDDICSEVSYLNSRIDMSPDRLQQVEDRMSLIFSLMQKHGCRSESELLSVRDALSELLFDSTTLEQKRESVVQEMNRTTAALDEVAGLLHKSRSEAKDGFVQTMTEAIRGLELPYAIFDVELSQIPVGPYGKDSIVFRFSSTGRNLVEIAKCASGGEMSRIMLALKAMRARYANMPTMIFDEIDTGVSGSVADKMGSMICDMGRYMQVFAITHLPQVAAKGLAHYLVSKSIDPDTSRAETTIKRLSGEQRVLEIARMLSGSSLTDAAVANARSLLTD